MEEQSTQTLTPDEFVGVSGQYVIPGPSLLQMFGFDSAKCQIAVGENEVLTITEEGAPTTLSMAPGFWRLSGSSGILMMEFSTFLNSSYCEGLSRMACTYLERRWYGYGPLNKYQTLGSDKTPYLVRDFLNDFPNREKFLEIFGIGKTAADEFDDICKTFALPYNQK